MNLKQTLGLLGHETDVSGLHQFQQNSYHEALAELNAMGEDPLSVLGANKPWDVAKYFFAAKDPTGRKAVEGDFPQTNIVYLGERVELGQTPAPVVFSVPSPTSRRAAVVTMVFTGVNALGYGAIDTAVCWVEGVYDDIDAANDRVDRIGKAVRTLVTVTNLLDRRAEYNGRPVDSDVAF